MRGGIATAVVVAVLLSGAAPAWAATPTTTTAPHRTTTTTAPHRSTTTTAPHRTTTTAPRRTVRRHTARRGDFEVVLGIVKTRRAAERLIAEARRHGLRPGVEREGRGTHRRFEVEINHFRTRAAADRELARVRRMGFRNAFVERS